MQNLRTFFSKNISVYAIFNDQSFDDTLTNGIVSFEQLGPVLLETDTLSDESSLSNCFVTTQKNQRICFLLHWLKNIPSF